MRFRLWRRKRRISEHPEVADAIRTLTAELRAQNDLLAHRPAVSSADLNARLRDLIRRAAQPRSPRNPY